MSILKRGVSGSRGVFLLPAVPWGRNDVPCWRQWIALRFFSLDCPAPLFPFLSPLFSLFFFLFFFFRPFSRRFCKSRKVDNVIWLSVHRGDFLTEIPHLSRFLFDVNRPRSRGSLTSSAAFYRSAVRGDWNPASGERPGRIPVVFIGKTIGVNAAMVKEPSGGADRCFC